MPAISDLAGRIDAEFSAVEQKVKKLQEQQVQDYEQRQKRVEQLARVFDELREVWKPRLDLLVKKFGDNVKVTPKIIPSAREAIFDFQSRVARVTLKFGATTDRDVRHVVLTYDVVIIPVLMRFKAHDEVEFPLDAVDKERAAKWADDRIVEFVQTYFAMGENEIYLKDQMVEDPVAHVRFPKIAAAMKIDHNGNTFYFIGEETRREFEKQNGITAK
jgi:YHS domain-containing protein